MTAMPLMPHEFREWTIGDLERVPDDGLQYELLDGMLLVSPAPTRNHQRVVGRLFILLSANCPRAWRPLSRHWIGDLTN